MTSTHSNDDSVVTPLEQDADDSCRGCQHGLWAGPEQRSYQGHRINDTVLIRPTRGSLEVETDVIIPFAVDPLKGTAGVRDMMIKNKAILTKALMQRIPDNDRGPWFHQHYAPNLLPNVASLHVHIAGTAKTPTEAKRLADDLWGVVDADSLTTLLE